MEPSRKLPVRLQTRRTLHPSVLTVKTPRHLKTLGGPAKRNILGKCMENSPTYAVRRPPKCRIPVNNLGVQPLVATNANRSMSKASPLVPMEEYEKHEGTARVGIFKDFQKYRTLGLPPRHTPELLGMQSSKLLSSGKQIRCNRNSEFIHQKKYTYKENVGKNLIPVPRSPLLLHGVRKVQVNNVSTRTGESDLATKSSMFGNPSLGKSYPFNPRLTYHNQASQPPPSQTQTRWKRENETSTTANASADDVNRLLQPCDFQKQGLQDTYQSKASTSFEPMIPKVNIEEQNCKKQELLDSSNQSKASTSFEPMIPKVNIEEQNTPSKYDLPGPGSLVNPHPDTELKLLSLQQELRDLQNRKISLQTELTDVQQKQLDCYEKIIKLQEEKISFLQNQNTTLKLVKSGDIAEGVSDLTLPELCIESSSPAPKRRRSSRLQMQAQCDNGESQLIVATSSLSSMTPDNDSSTNELVVPINSSTRKRASRRKSVVEYYGGLRSSFKHLLQTPKETPCPGPYKSAKKVQFNVQDTPSRLTSTVMKQLNNLYDS